MSLPRYTLRQLDAFVTVADMLSFTAAADRLALTPSAVSQLVVELESSLGFKLFERSTRKVALSAAGQAFYGSAQTVLKHLRLAEVAATDLRNRAAGLVRIAAPMVIASTILPPLIRDYTLERPKLVVRIRDAAVEQLTDVVASGEVDLAIGPDRPGSDAVLHTPLFSSPWVLWCAKNHPLALPKQLQWADVRAHALITAGRDHEISVAQMGAALPEEERQAYFLGQAEDDQPVRRVRNRAEVAASASGEAGDDDEDRHEARTQASGRRSAPAAAETADPTAGRPARRADPGARRAPSFEDYDDY